MNKLEIFKAVTGFVIGAGVSQIITGIVVNNVALDTNTQKVLAFAGKTGITMLVSDAVRAHTDTKIDSAAAWMTKNVHVNVTHL